MPGRISAQRPGRTSSWDPPGPGYHMQWWYCPHMSLEVECSTRKLTETLPLELMARLTQPALSLSKQQVPKCCSVLLLSALCCHKDNELWSQLTSEIFLLRLCRKPEARRFTGGFPSVGLRRSPLSSPSPCSWKLHRRKWEQVPGKSMSVLSLFLETLGGLDPQLLSAASPASPALCL